MAQGVADVPALRRRRRRQVGALDDAAKIGLLCAQVLEQRLYVGGDGGLPWRCERTLT
jgi:hypothetical protein